jgi:hypothetical protein
MMTFEKISLHFFENLKSWSNYIVAVGVVFQEAWEEEVTLRLTLSTPPLSYPAIPGGLIYGDYIDYFGEPAASVSLQTS